MENLDSIQVSKAQAEFLKRFGGKVMSERVAEILQEASFGSDYVELNSGTLSRTDYEDVRNFLESIGGKWKGGGKKPDGSPKGTFVFQYVAPKPIVEMFVAQRFLPAKNPLDFFPTPRKTALTLLTFAGLIEKETWNGGIYVPKRTAKDLKILEPNAGLGGLVDVVREFYPDAQIHCVELNPVSAEVLRKKGYTVYEQDFLSFDNQGYYDYVVMNPPFDGTTYIKHVFHAWKMVELRLGLVAGILPNTMRNSQKLVKEFWNWVNCIGESEPLESGSFKESGTNVETVVFWVDKEREQARIERKEYNGFPNFSVWHLIVIAENNDAQVANEIKKLAYKNTPITRKVLRDVLDKVAQTHIESNGIGCLTEEDFEYATAYFVEQGEHEKEYEKEKALMKEQKVKTPTPEMNANTPKEAPKKLLRFSKEALKFVPKAQVSVVNANLEGFQEIIADINRIVASMPKLYEQDSNLNPIIYLHYFHANQDWYIAEKDTEDRQLQAYGNANLGYGGEWGYMNIENLVNNPRIELDFHFEPMTFQSAKGVKEGKKPDFQVGDKVKYQTGDLYPETWYGEIKTIVGKNGIGGYLYRVEAFNLESHMKSLEKHTEISSGQLKAIAEDTYQKHLKEWEKKYMSLGPNATTMKEPAWKQQFRVEYKDVLHKFVEYGDYFVCINTPAYAYKNGSKLEGLDNLDLVTGFVSTKKQGAEFHGWWIADKNKPRNGTALGIVVTEYDNSHPKKAIKIFKEVLLQASMPANADNKELWQMTYPDYVKAVWEGNTTYIVHDDTAQEGSFKPFIEKYEAAKQGTDPQTVELVKSEIERRILPQKSHSYAIIKAYKSGKDVPNETLAQARQDYPNVDFEKLKPTPTEEYTLQDKFDALQRLYKINKNPEIKGYMDALKRLIKLKNLAISHPSVLNITTY